MGATTMAEVGHQRRGAGARYYFAARAGDACRASSSPRCSSSACARRCATPTSNVPLHRARLDAAGVAPDDIAQRSTTSRGCRSPSRPTCATTIRSACSRGRASELARLHASSGTTGKPTVVGYTRERPRHLGRPDGALAGLRRRAAAATWSTTPTATACSPAAWARTTAPSGSAPTVVPMSGGSTERQVALIMDFGARVLCATPSYALAIAEVAEQQGVDLRTSALEVGLFGAEPWSEAMRARDRGAARPARRSTSTACPRSWARASPANASARPACTAGRTTSCSRSSTPRPARAVPEGEAGELVITTLTKEALPMLRYRTRDITRVTTRAVRLRPHAPAHPAHHRAQRRHADHPRRQRLSVADRGGAGRAARASRRTTSSWSSAAAASTT